MVKRLIALSLITLMIGQAALAGSGGLQLCLPLSSGSFQVYLNCNDSEVAPCCGEDQRELLDFADSYETCKLCWDIKLKVERDNPWLPSERSSPKVLTLLLVVDLSLSYVKMFPSLLFEESQLSLVQPHVNDALQQFRDLVSLRL